MKTKFLVLSAAVALLTATGPIRAVAQQSSTNGIPAPVLALSNGVPSSVLALFESYLTVNDPSCTAWVSNRFVLAQAAAFASVNGTPGESAIGNDLIAEYVVSGNWMVDSGTRFEQIFGDIAHQEFGVDYSIFKKYQLRISGGVDGRYIFEGARLRAVPNLRLEKASTQLNGLGAWVGYGVPIQSKPGWGELRIGALISF